MENKAPRGSEPRIKVHVTINPGTYKKLQAAAKATDRSISYTINNTLETALNANTRRNIA